MATSIAMPQLGESVTEGTVGRWLKAIGDRIEKDEPLVEVVTDKVNVEIPSPEAGYLVKIAVPEGQTVPVGTELAQLDAQPGAAAGTASSGGSAGAAAPMAGAGSGAPPADGSGAGSITSSVGSASAGAAP